MKKISLEDEFLLACCNGRTEVATNIINNSQTKSQLMEYKGYSFNSLLMTASFNGHLPIVELLIKNGANIFFQNNSGETALHFSVENKRINTTELLLKSCANLQLKDNNNITPFSLAIKKDFTAMLDLLTLDIINKQYTDGNTLLISACQDKNDKRILFLYKKGADFNIKNNEGQSAYTILHRKRALSPVIQALKEKLILDNMCEEELASSQVRDL